MSVHEFPTHGERSEHEPGRGRGHLRVLLVCDWFLKYVAELALGLAENGHRVCILCRGHALEFGGDADERSLLLERVRAAGVEVYEVPGRPFSHRGLGKALAVIRAARRFRPDVVHAQEAIYDPRLFPAAAGKPLVLTLHDPRPHLGAKTRTRHRFLRGLWDRKADVLVVHSENLVDQIGETEARIAVIPHGADVRPRPEPVPGRPSVLLFGRLEYYKGLRVLLEAMQEVWRARPEATLQVVGEGSEADVVPDDPRIEARLGYLPEDQVDQVFAAASLVVLPYIDASQSGVGLLALARGIPLVVTSVGGLGELALNDSFVAEPRDPHSLAERILAHLDHDENLRNTVLDMARERFSWPAVAARSAAVYEEVLCSND